MAKRLTMAGRGAGRGALGGDASDHRYQMGGAPAHLCVFVRWAGRARAPRPGRCRALPRSAGVTFQTGTHGQATGSDPNAYRHARYATAREYLPTANRPPGAGTAVAVDALHCACAAHTHRPATGPPTAAGETPASYPVRLVLSGCGVPRLCQPCFALRTADTAVAHRPRVTQPWHTATGQPSPDRASESVGLEICSVPCCPGGSAGQALPRLSSFRCTRAPAATFARE
jgi:hypothetical protein